MTDTCANNIRSSTHQTFAIACLFGIALPIQAQTYYRCMHPEQGVVWGVSDIHRSQYYNCQQINLSTSGSNRSNAGDGYCDPNDCDPPSPRSNPPKKEQIPASRPNRKLSTPGPGAAQMLHAMRSHYAASIGRNMFMLVGVEKGSCARVKVNQYRCTYKPNIRGNNDNAIGILIGVTPSSWNTALFTRVGSTWYFGGAE